MNDQTSPETLVAGLVDLLTVSRKSEDAYTAEPQPGGVGRVFGGQVVAQALQAAQASVPDDLVAHSLHAYFLRGGEEGPPIDLSIARDFDGRSFANRRVVASQTDKDGTPRPILNLTASFQRPEKGLSHEASPMPDVPPPEELLTDAEVRRQFLEDMPNVPEDQRNWALRPRPIEMRNTNPVDWRESDPREPEAAMWLRTVASLPDDPAIHRAVIAYASDYSLLGTAALPHGISFMRGEIKGASLDHAVWFHAPARADEWLLYVTDSPWSGGGRGFNRGRIFTRDGKLVASTAQEGVLRQTRKKR